MSDASKPKPQRSTTNSKGRQNSPPPYRSHAETSMEELSVACSLVFTVPKDAAQPAAAHRSVLPPRWRASSARGRRPVRRGSEPRRRLAGALQTLYKSMLTSTACLQRQRVRPPHSLNPRLPSWVLTRSLVCRFWQHAMNVAEHHEDDFKHQALPLARIKKVAKMDPEVQVRRAERLRSRS